MIAFSGIYNLYTNYLGDSCYDLDEIPLDAGPDFLETHCIKDYITEFTLANKIDNDNLMDKQEIFNLLTIVTMIIVQHYLRKLQKESALVYDEDVITASDFTARVSNLPRDFGPGVDVDEQIKQWFEVNGLPGKRLNIQGVNLCQDVTEKLETLEEIESLSLRKSYLLKERSEGKQAVSDEELAKIDEEMQKNYKILDRINNEFKTGITDKFIGECFITFETQQELQAVLKHWKTAKLNKRREAANPASIYKYRGKLLKVVQADEPTEVFWENAGISKRERRARRLTTALGTLFVLVCSFLVGYFTENQEVQLI